MVKKPVIHPSAFIAPSAAVLGDVTIGADCGVYFGAVIRAERENCVLHVDEGYPLTVGENCTVGHGAILHGCTVGDNSLIGMGAIVLNGAVIGRNCIVGAGALVPQNAVIPDGSLAVGCPAKIRRAVTDADVAANERSAAFYVEESREYKKELGL